MSTKFDKLYNKLILEHNNKKSLEDKLQYCINNYETFEPIEYKGFEILAFADDHNDPFRFFIKNKETGEILEHYYDIESLDEAIKEAKGVIEAILVENDSLGTLSFTIDSEQDVFDHDWDDQLRVIDQHFLYGGKAFRTILKDIINSVNYHMLDLMPFGINEDFGKDFTKYQFDNVYSSDAEQIIEKFNEMAEQLKIKERLLMDENFKEE